MFETVAFRALHAPSMPALVAQVVFLWLGLYLLGRRPRSRVTLLAALAMTTLSVYLVGTILAENSTSIETALTYSKALWLAPWPAALWLHTTLELTGSRSRMNALVMGALYSSATLLTFAGWFDGALFSYSDAEFSLGATPALYFPVESGYWLFALYLTVTVGVAVYVLASQAARHTQESGAPLPLLWLLAGSVVFLMSAMLLTYNALTDWLMPEGWLLISLLVGAGVVGFAVSNYGGLVEGQVLRQDFLSSLVGMGLVISSLAVLMMLAEASVAAFQVAAILLTALYTLRGQLQLLTDIPFYDRSGRAERRMWIEAAHTAGGAARHLDADRLLPGQLETHILTALQNAYPTARLVQTQSPLLRLAAVDVGVSRELLNDPQARANALARILSDLLETMGEEPQVDESMSFDDRSGAYCSLRYYLVKNQRIRSKRDERVLAWRKTANKTNVHKLRQFEQQGAASLAASLKQLDVDARTSTEPE